MSAEQFVTPDQLCIGLFVELDLSWMEHPFAFSRFKIRNAQQIETLRQLGLERIRFDPARSDCAPLPAAAAVAPVESVAPVVPVAATPAVPTELQQAMAEKRRHAEALGELRRQIGEVEQRFVRAADALKQITRLLRSRPEEAFESADALVSELAETAFADGDIKLHALSQQLGEDVYFHSLNVTVLSMMLGRAIHLRRDELHQLGIGAVLHDIGHLEVPDAILVKREPLTRAETAIYESHCRAGVKLAARLGLSEGAQSVIGQHHERVDGSGYPEHLRGHQITLFARIVGLINRYDNLCNPANMVDAATPYEALSQMFGRERAQFDEDLLRRLIKLLGVYPPGSLVELSDGRIGLVLSVDPDQPLRPDVLVHDPDVPKEAAPIIKLAEHEGVRIVRSLRAAHLPREVVAYLNPRTRVTYFVERSQAPKR